MKKSLVLLFSLLLFGLIIGGTTRRNANSFAQNPISEISPDDGGSEMWKLDSIDEKALQAKDNDETAVRALADEVFNTSDFAALPVETRESMKDRVLRAELSYRKDGAGVDEETVVQVVNEYVNKFGAPEYAKTSTLQVRYLRATLVRGYPNFIAQPLPGEREGLDQEVGTSINSMMSPLEAAYVTAVLLQQKMLNEEYQKTPQEWADSISQTQLEEWQADANRISSGEQAAPAATPSQPQLEMRADNSKYGEMRQAFTNNAMKQVIGNGASALWSSNLQVLADTVLDDFGIPR